MLVSPSLIDHEGSLRGREEAAISDKTNLSCCELLVSICLRIEGAMRRMRRRNSFFRALR